MMAARSPRVTGTNGMTRDTGTHNGRAIIADKDRMLAALSERHGFPDPHP